MDQVEVKNFGDMLRKEFNEKCCKISRLKCDLYRHFVIKRCTSFQVPWHGDRETSDHMDILRCENLCVYEEQSNCFAGLFIIALNEDISEEEGGNLWSFGEMMRQEQKQIDITSAFVHKTKHLLYKQVANGRDILRAWHKLVPPASKNHEAILSRLLLEGLHFHDNNRILSINPLPDCSPNSHIESPSEQKEKSFGDRMREQYFKNSPLENIVEMIKIFIEHKAKTGSSYVIFDNTRYKKDDEKELIEILEKEDLLVSHIDNGLLISLF